MTTKSDAIEKILPEACSGEMYRDAARLVDALSALGILKLDEPKDGARELFMDVIESYGDLRAGDAQRILALVERSGLRIVEK